MPGWRSLGRTVVIKFICQMIRITRPVLRATLWLFRKAFSWRRPLQSHARPIIAESWLGVAKSSYHQLSQNEIGSDTCSRHLSESQCPVTAASSTGRCNTIYSIDPTALPHGEPLRPAVLNQTLARMVLRLNQRARTTLSYSGPASGFRPVLGRPIETTALIRS